MIHGLGKNEVWPSSELETVDVCPLCMSGSNRVLHRGLCDYCFESGGGNWTVFGCLNCGSSYLNPRPVSSSIGRAYEAYYTHSHGFQKKGWLTNTWRSLRDGYLERKYGSSVYKKNLFGYLFFWLIPVLRCGIDSAYARNLPESVSGGRLLDVGCGNGGFLFFAKSIGWTVKGLDLDPLAVEAATSLGLNVIQGTLDDILDDAVLYDWITVSHVIEHVYDPRDLVEKCFRLLKPGGYLWIDTPNAESTGARFFREYWRGYEPPRHLTILSRQALFQILLSSGFVDVSEKFSSLATLGIWRESNRIIKKSGGSYSLIKSIFGLVVAYFLAIVNPRRREFITLLCRKK